MIVAIHQPNYIPWLGFFDKIKRSDIFIFMDNVQYRRGSWGNRYWIKSSQVTQRLTIPVMTSGVFGQKIAEAKIDYKTDWVFKHLKTTELNYKKTLYFGKFFPHIKEILEQKIESLAELNIKLIEKISGLFELKTKFVVGSSLNVSGQATDLLINMVKAVGGDAYICGGGAVLYQEDEKFIKHDLKLIYQNFQHPVYPQRFEGFIPGLSAIDFLFNVGGKLP